MSNSKRPVLLVDDEDQILLSYSLILRTSGIDDVLTVNDSRQVFNHLDKQDISAVVLDLVMPYVSGTELLVKITHDYPQIPVIVMTATNELEMAIDCMKGGAFDYLVKPVEKSRFVSSVQKALEVRALRDEITSLKKHLLSDSLKNREAFSPYISNSKKIHAVFRYVEAIAELKRPVCICGETGVGKELLAGIIHTVSGLKGDFVAVNVAGLDDTMFSDTLFGHKKGAFTGADQSRKGLVAKAAGGVLLLDEFGDLNESSQLKLLRLIEEQKYYPLGSDTAERSDVRIIAATNRDIENQIAAGNFRRDLYYRLCAHSIYIPPLRERPEDVPLLLEHFLELASNSLGKKRPSCPKELLTMLTSYSFPGNVRELQAMVFDAVAQHESGMLSLNGFRQFMKHKNLTVRTVVTAQADGNLSLFKNNGRLPTLGEAEDILISEALKRAQGNQGIAASLLGITRQALNKRIKRKEDAQE
ncbi:MAG: sigma-54-dependent Fis family transcriptional regulator [Nitrospiraceae bacterium]|nr:MAG: sigma-54-dependent Fis family transcriptional regulator [Nitrospiraceae bacterium]